MTFDPREQGAQCDRCPLRDCTPVPPEAIGKVRLIVVGENPGRFEALRLRPFIGASGKLLDSVLDEAGFDRRNAHITNTVLCPAQDDKELAAAIPCCAPRLAAELASLPADVPILSLGASAARITIGKAGVLKYRGFIWRAPEIKATQLRSAERLWQKRVENKAPLKQITKALDSFEVLKARAKIAGRVVVPSIHPAMVLRGADAFLPVLRLDVKRIVRWSKAPFPLEDEGPFVKTVDEKLARRVLASMSDTVTVDIETNDVDPMRCKITCVGVCDVNDVSKVLVLDPPPRPPNSGLAPDFFAQFPKLLPVLQGALGERTCIFHNGPAFDVIALGRRGIVAGKIEDTLVAHRSMASHMPQALSHVASIYCDAQPWKQKFKSAEEKSAVAGFGVRAEDLAAYNAADVRLDALSWRRMQGDLEPERKIYEFDMRMAALYTKMQIAGIRADTARQAALSRKLRFRAAALVGEMRELLERKHFKPSKPNDIRKALFGQLKAPRWLAPPTPTGLPSTAQTVLEALRTHETRAGKLADLIMRWRSANDSRSEYLDGVHVDTDGRVHATWKQIETGRPACRRPNLLNIPRMAYCDSCGVKLLESSTHDESKRRKKNGRLVACSMPQPEELLRDIYVAAPGCKFVYFDLSQAEMRFAANLSGDANFIKACSKDVHVENACVLFPDGADMIRADPKGAGKKFREIAKSMGFAVSYLAEAETVFTKLRAKGFDVSMDDVETMLDNLHSGYKDYYAYVDRNVELCRKTGYLRTFLHGRKRWLGFFPKPTTVSNFPIQSGVADVMNERLLLLDERKPKNATLVYYWYDAAIYETPSSEVVDMEKVIKEVWSKEIWIPDREASFLQPIDMKTGERLSDF